MAIKACNTRILIDEFDFSGDTQGVTVGWQTEALEANTLQSCARKYIPGQAGGVIDQNGYWNGPDAGDIEPELNARLGLETGVVVSVLFDTRAVGNPAYVQPASFGSKVTIEAPVEGLLTIAAAWENAMRRGLCLADGAFDDTDPGTTVDCGIAGAAGGWAALHVRDITGMAVEATFVVECDDNSGFTSATTKGTFTVSDEGAEVIDLAGTVDRYVRLRCTSLGGADAIDVVAIVGVDGVTG